MLKRAGEGGAGGFSALLALLYDAPVPSTFTTWLLSPASHSCRVWQQESGTYHACMWVCMYVWVRVCTPHVCLVETQAERSSGKFRRRLSLPLLDLAAPLSLSPGLCLSHSGSHNSAL